MQVPSASDEGLEDCVLLCLQLLETRPHFSHLGLSHLNVATSSSSSRDVYLYKSSSLLRRETCRCQADDNAEEDRAGTSLHQSARHLA